MNYFPEQDMVLMETLLLQVGVGGWPGGMSSPLSSLCIHFLINPPTHPPIHAGKERL